MFSGSDNLPSFTSIYNCHFRAYRFMERSVLSASLVQRRCKYMTPGHRPTDMYTHQGTWVSVWRGIRKALITILLLTLNLTRVSTHSQITLGLCRSSLERDVQCRHNIDFCCSEKPQSLSVASSLNFLSVLPLWIQAAVFQARRPQMWDSTSLHIFLRTGE